MNYVGKYTIHGAFGLTTSIESPPHATSRLPEAYVNGGRKRVVKRREAPAVPEVIIAKLFGEADEMLGNDGFTHR